jgi:drug/metabolite transporter (DMT)-like permease
MTASMGPLVLVLISALLFGAATPASKLLLDALSPLQLAGLLYLGAALATGPIAWSTRRTWPGHRADRATLGRLAGAVVLGGVVAPILVLLALQTASSASVALLLNLEMAATAVLGVIFFREHMGALAWLGVACGLGAALLLSAGGALPSASAALLVVGASSAWGMDNHLTALIDGLSPAETTAWKGLVAGATNLGLGLALAPLHASSSTIAIALAVGALSYGASIALYVVGSHHLGATRAQVVFSSAPFIGAALSFALLDEPLGVYYVAASAALIAGVALLYLDRHEHEHAHPALEHVHSHRHDDGHHDHAHAGQPASTRHTHFHRHESVRHSHRHLPDLHHRHAHPDGGQVER